MHLKGAELEVLHSVNYMREAASATSDAERARVAESVLKARAIFDTEFVTFRNSIVNDDNLARTAQVQGLYEELAAAEDSLLHTITSRQTGEVKAQLDALGQKSDAISKLMTKLQETKLLVMAESAAETRRTYEASRRALLLLVLCSMLVAMLAGFGLARYLARPLIRAAEVLEQVAQGDFSVRLSLDSDDEVGRMAKSLNRAIEGMRRALLEVNASSGEVTGAAQQLASASERLAKGAHEQASSIEETAASLV